VKKAACLFVAFLSFYKLASASSVDCTTVLNTNVLSLGACSLDGLVFDQFLVNSVPSGSSIFLSAVGTGVIGDSINLGFQITTPAPPSDTLFEYHVSTLSGASTIVGVDNFHNGTDGVRIGELVCSVPFVGGGLPPSPSIATVPINGTPTQVIIGAAQLSGGVSTEISPQQIGPAIIPARKLIYWKSSGTG